MKHIFNKSISGIIIFTFFIMIGCTEKIERSGIVVDRNTNEPLEGVSIDLYLKYQRRDSLKDNVFTDEKGYFYITEKIDEDELFQLRMDGYIGHVSSLSIENDTIKLERIED